MTGDVVERDVSYDPHLDLSRFPQDPEARRPGELLREYLDRLCASRCAPLASPHDPQPEPE